MTETCFDQDCARGAESAVMLVIPAGDVSVKAVLDLRFCSYHIGTFKLEDFLQRGFASYLQRHFARLGLPPPIRQAITVKRTGLQP